jgi:hypothetical protein
MRILSIQEHQLHFFIFILNNFFYISYLYSEFLFITNQSLSFVFLSLCSRESYSIRFSGSADSAFLTNLNILYEHILNPQNLYIKDTIFQLILGTHIILNYIFLIQNNFFLPFYIYFRKSDTDRDLPCIGPPLAQLTTSLHSLIQLTKYYERTSFEMKI